MMAELSCTKSNMDADGHLSKSLTVPMDENKKMQLDNLHRIRRSTRRATIERRIWCEPKKVEKVFSAENKRGRRKNLPKKHCEILKSALLNRQTSSANKSNVPMFPNAKVVGIDMKTEGTLVEENEIVPLERAIPDEIIDNSSISLPTKSPKEALSNDHNIESSMPTSANLPSDGNNCDAIDFSMPKQEKVEESHSTNLVSPHSKSSESNTPSDSVGDERSHVSLSEALEQLIDPSTNLQAETVTIHPVLPSMAVDKLETNVTDNTNNDGGPLNLKMSEQCLSSSNLNGHIVNQKDMTTKELEVSSDDCQSACSTENTHGSRSPLNLVKPVENSDSFKMPIKCPECSMRFDSARFLLWHFGTHEKQTSKQDSLSNFLADLAVEWDDPTQIVNAPRDWEMLPDIHDYHTSIYNTPPKSNHCDDLPEDLSQTKDHYKNNVILKVPTPRFNSRIGNECNGISKSVSSGKLKEIPSKQYMVASSPQSRTSIKESSTNKVTIIPIDKSPNINKNRTPEEKLEKDDLVVINPNLALRIVSTSASSQLGELTISTSSNSSNHSKNSLTILPQSQALYSQKETRPDILTIVPQTDNTASSRTTHLQTANGEIAADSQIMNLVLVPPKTQSTATSEDDDSEGSECGMVIDVEDEEPAMDPLSMCAVTMDVDPTKGKEDNKPSIEQDNKVPATDSEKYKNRRYVCQFCQKRFGWSTDLKRHIILHTGERPFKCKWCPINFTRKFLLQNHMKKIHPGLFKLSDMWE